MRKKTHAFFFFALGWSHLRDSTVASPTPLFWARFSGAAGEEWGSETALWHIETAYFFWVHAAAPSCAELIISRATKGTSYHYPVGGFASKNTRANTLTGGPAAPPIQFNSTYARAASARKNRTFFFIAMYVRVYTMATNSCTAAAFWSFGPDFWIETARKGGIPGQTSTGFLVVAGVAEMPENGWFWLKSAKNLASRAGFLHVWLAMAESAEMVAFSCSASLGQLHRRLHILCFGGLISGSF